MTEGGKNGKRISPAKGDRKGEAGSTLTVQRAPLMRNITAYRVILIPLLGVPFSGAMHVMAIDIAWKRYRTERRKE
jgi:hypothetical protein